jgi:GNAT superfamily N-acetyltransferase
MSSSPASGSSNPTNRTARHGVERGSSVRPVQRILSHLRRTVEATADEVRAIPEGWVARTRSMPLVWTLNQICLTGSTTPVEALRLADRHQGDLTFRHLSVERSRTADALAGPLREEGWGVEREAYMVLAGPPDREVDTRGVVELTEDQMLELMRRWLVEERVGATDAELDQVTEYNRREGRTWNERRLGIVGPGGEPVTVTKLRSDGEIAWVEDVYTVPEARRRGHARAVVSRAAELARSAGHGLTFIIADDEDWPKELYAKIGFRPVGTTHTFHLEALP